MPCCCAPRSGELQQVIARALSQTPDQLTGRGFFFAAKPRPGVADDDSVVCGRQFDTADTGRMDCLRAINEAAHRLNDERRGRVLVTVVTASPIDDQLLSQINSQLSAALGKQAILQTRVNPELLGGLEVRIGDKVYDGSLRTRLEEIRQAAAGASN